MMRAREWGYAIAAALSGTLWFGLAFLFDAMGGPTGWAMPTRHVGELGAFLICGVITGVVVSYLFRPTFRRARFPSELLLPFLTLPFAISLFALLVWVVRLGLGYRFYEGVPPTRDLTLILEAYFFYSFVSIFLPVLYAFALVNQGVMHLILVSGVEQRVAPDGASRRRPR